MDQDARSVRERLRRIIEQRTEEIERRWLARVQQDIVKQPGVELTLLRDGMPDYLIELAKVLGNGADPLDHRAESAWARVARDHGITRVRIGFDIGQLVHEFIVLRRTIQEVVREEDPSLGPADILADLLEAAIAVAVQAYADARDFESRRAQAANVGFLTHELRHPLSAASLAAARLRRSATPDQESALAILDRGLHRLSELIDGVLLTEKLEAGEVTIAPTQTTLGQLMEPVETLRGPAEQKGLRFRTEYDPDLSLAVDVDLTRSVLQNLAENAVKYTDDGEVKISIKDAGDDVVVDVRDTCKGLSPEELATIFEPFKRGRTDKTGTGLGLAIARRAVEAQGGSIHAESPGPSGCHFSVRLPRYALRDAAPAHAPAP
jgi:signal transduction histidine kinase